MIDVLAIDRWSSQRRGWLHRASAPAKLVAVAACIAILIASRDVAVLALVYASLLATLVTSGLPVRPLLVLSAIPLTMSALFALTRLGGTWASAVAIMEKGAITSLLLLLLVASTPAVDLLSVVRRVIPRTLAEILFLGYRSIFILVARVLAAREAVRLRSGHMPLPAQLRRNALVGALAVLRASELASEQYAAMRLRGLGAAPGLARARSPGADATVVTAGAILVAGSVVVGQAADGTRQALLAALALALVVILGFGLWRRPS